MPGRGVGSLSWAQDPGPQWGEKELRGHLPCSRGLLRGFPWGALDICSEVLRCRPSSVHSVADYCRAPPGVAVEDRGSMERLLRTCTGAAGNHLFGSRLRTKLLLFSPATQTDRGYLNFYAPQRRAFPELRFKLRFSTSSCLGWFPTPQFLPHLTHASIEHTY